MARKVTDYMTRKVIPLMLEKQTGHIINIGSIAGHEAYEGGAGSCALPGGGMWT